MSLLRIPEVEWLTTNATLIDGHNDLAIVLRYAYGNKIYEKHFTNPFEKGGLKGQVDLQRLKDGKSGGFFWSAYVACPKNGTDFSDANYAEGQSIKMALQRQSISCPKRDSCPQFQNQQVNKHPNTLQLFPPLSHRWT